MYAKRISDIIFRIRDFERSLIFYRDVLGMHVKTVVPGDWIFVDGGGVQLNLHVGDSNPGSNEIVFEVDDIHAACQALSAHGVKFRTQPRSVTSTKTHNLLAADFRDPDGHVLSLKAWEPKP